MFDPVTALIIASAPKLSGVDSERLPSLITDAYVKVAVAKSLLGDDLVARDDVFGELRSIGASQEAIALNLEPGELRSSAAYVAASAYRALAEAFPDADSDSPRLEPGSIAPRIASVLLFLVADASADAAEVANDLQPTDGETFAPLIQRLRQLGRGEVRVTSKAPEVALDNAAGPTGVGAAVGYWRCERVLTDLLAYLANPREGSGWEAGRFAQIASAMGSEFTFRSPEGLRTSINLIAGPWHLAKLLDMAESVLIESSTASIPTPTGIDESRWWRTLSGTIRQRPLLWRNHRAALDSGLLDPGVSAVLSFPTGAGKSTVSELKVAATVLRNKNVVCLAPTLSLIDQLARSFRLAAPDARVTAQRDADEELVPTEDDVSEIFIMTPESCLSALGLDPARFGDVGLILFDEAHLMHSEGETPTRRALDASLCFLTLASRFPASDLMLVSAMFANTSELAGWLSDITGRRALALDNPWKPTRQARGALVYRLDEIERLRESLDVAYRTTTTQGAPATVRKAMVAVPHGFFSLQSTWESTNTRDYRLTPLLETPVQLGVGGHRDRQGAWWLTPNANQVAARLAHAAAESGLKTLVFTQQIGWTSSIARDVSSSSEHKTPLVEAELRLVDRSAELLGDRSALYLDFDGNAVVGAAIPHHGLLLPDERRLHELLYRRPDGVPVLVATSTVSQGMNFPSEFVIIAGDRRFDSSSNERIRLEAHELLNAAGRAGRAGSHANALVLAIPGEVVEYDGAAQMGSGWSPLQAAFSKSDQCVTVDDPIRVLLDGLDSETEAPLLEYLSRRVGSVADAVVGPEMLRRSFAAYSARERGSDEWIGTRVAQLTATIAGESIAPWARRCSLISGLPVADVMYVAERLDPALEQSRVIKEWVEWVLDVLHDRPAMVEEVLRVGSRAALTGAPEELGEWSAASTTLIDHIRAILPLWMEGAALLEIQDIGIARGLASVDRRLEFARKFVLRVVPDLAYLFGLPVLIQGQRAMLGERNPLPDDHPLFDISRCVELGVDSAEKVRMLESSSRITRKQAHIS
ncbi:DEAD/DEAH box helicase [Microbacterium jejuense]|uniref:DEAD/DEAH box helicase n=1 Tax=Microbacterium jejuense TaxID=1263637 RepID=UPI0031E89DE5